MNTLFTARLGELSEKGCCHVPGKAPGWWSSQPGYKRLTTRPLWGREGTSCKHTSYTTYFITCCTYFGCCWDILTCLTVVHPVKYDLRCSVPARHNVTRHLALRLSGQAKIQNLKYIKKKKYCFFSPLIGLQSFILFFCLIFSVPSVWSVCIMV